MRAPNWPVGISDGAGRTCGRPVSDGEQRFDGAAFATRLVALSYLGEWKRQLERLARVDASLQGEIAQLGQERPYRCVPATGVGGVSGRARDGGER